MTPHETNYREKETAVSRYVNWLNRVTQKKEPRDTPKPAFLPRKGMPKNVIAARIREAL